MDFTNDASEVNVPPQNDTTEDFHGDDCDHCFNPLDNGEMSVVCDDCGGNVHEGCYHECPTKNDIEDIPEQN